MSPQPLSLTFVKFMQNISHVIFIFVMALAEGIRGLCSFALVFSAWGVFLCQALRRRKNQLKVFLFFFFLSHLHMMPAYLTAKSLRKHTYAKQRKLSWLFECTFVIFCDMFLIFVPNIDRGCSLEPPNRGGSNEHPQSMFLR